MSSGHFLSSVKAIHLKRGRSGQILSECHSCVMRRDRLSFVRKALRNEFTRESTHLAKHEKTAVFLLRGGGGFLLVNELKRNSDLGYTRQCQSFLRFARLCISIFLPLLSNSTVISISPARAIADITVPLPYIGCTILSPTENEATSLAGSVGLSEDFCFSSAPKRSASPRGCHGVFFLKKPD